MKVILVACASKDVLNCNFSQKFNFAEGKDFINYSAVNFSFILILASDG